ncbi:hypothetical protein N9D66_00020 [Candidatus Nanopelagicales bacterium]|nr:hypothetical protein [Candidatus Nanopelagicales bacterium]
MARWPLSIANLVAASARGHLLSQTQVNPELAKTRALIMFRDAQAGIFERLRGWLAAAAVFAIYVMILGAIAFALFAVTTSSLAVLALLAFAIVAPLPMLWHAAFRRGRLIAARALTDAETGDSSIHKDRLTVTNFVSWPPDIATEQHLWWAALGHRARQTVIVADSPSRVAELTQLGFRSLPWEPLVLTLQASPPQADTMAFAVVADDEPTIPNRVY